MKLKRRLAMRMLISLFLAAQFLTALQAQSVYVMKDNQSVLNYGMSNIRSFIFNDGNFTINNTNGTTNEISMSSIRYISFVDHNLVSDIEEKSVATSRLSCYPNPTDKQLNIEMTDTEGNISIEVYSTSGQIVLKRAGSFYNNLHTLDVSSLESGIYLCKVSTDDNTNMTSFIKQ